MNYLIDHFEQILKFSQQLALPQDKKLGILREYLQLKFIYHLYALKDSQQLSFVGGTSLRLLQDLPRFSEDLDFDNLGLSRIEIQSLVKTVVSQFGKDNLEVEFKEVKKGAKNYYELRFINLLQPLGLTTDPRQKLMIKIDYANYWQGQTPEVRLVNKYGLIQRVVTNSLNQLLCQKLTAYVQRRRTMLRDVYDCVWLFAQGARLDKAFLEKNQLGEVVELAQVKLSKEGIRANDLKRLKPFLFKEEEAQQAYLFEEVLTSLVK